MATIRARKRADGTTGHTVAWRLGGSRDGRQQSETFDRPADAERFRRDVEDAGTSGPPAG